MYSMEVQSINGIEASNIYQGGVYGDRIYSDIYIENEAIKKDRKNLLEIKQFI